MSWLGSLISGAANLATGIPQLIQSNKIAEQNLAFQRENLEYQKGLQQQIFDREDSAMQRKVADYKAAGFNPVLAAGGSGSPSGAIVSTQAPQRSQADFSGLDNIGSRVMSDYARAKTLELEKKSTESQIRKAEADIAMSGVAKKQAALEIDRMNQELAFNKRLEPYRLGFAMNQATLEAAKIRDLEQQIKFFSETSDAQKRALGLSNIGTVSKSLSNILLPVVLTLIKSGGV